MRPSTIAYRLAGTALALGLLSGCASTSEERQLADMRAEIDKIQDSRDKADRSFMDPEAADSKVPTVAESVSSEVPPEARTETPADQDAVTIGMATPGATDDYADTEDPTPRPNIRVFGSLRANGHGNWRSDDQVEQTAPDDAPSTDGKLDPAAPPAYDAALSLVNSRQYDKALDALAAFLVRWPDHPYADNAMYWRGECYFARGEYARASEQFAGVIARFPTGNKAPDALLKLGMSYQKLGDPMKAKQSYDRLTELYPQSEAAKRIPPVNIPATTPRGPASEDHR